MDEVLTDLLASPAAVGVLRMIVRRPDVGRRERLDEARLDVVEGLVGDNWRTRGSRHSPDGSAERDKQVTVMNARAAAAIAGEEERWPLAGDQLYVDLDISEASLPAGSRLAIGSAALTVTAPVHTGCRKFSDRFGVEALRWVASPEGRALRLRGMYARVTAGGVVRVGDAIRVVLPAGGA